MKKILIILFFSGLSLNALSQCAIDHWSLEKRVNNSNAIVEAEVLSQEGVWDSKGHNIYTISTLKVFKVFKGNIQSDLIQMVTPGGIVGMERHEVHPALEVQAGEIGVFLLATNIYPVHNSTKHFMPTASVQSFIVYDFANYRAIDEDRIFESIKFELYPALSDGFSELNSYDPEAEEGKIRALAPPVIDSFSVDSVTSGSEFLLTIYGSKFGIARGTNGKVGFKDANYGDGRYYYSPVSWSYVSWSNSQIKIYVPTRAGTGKVEVTTNAGESSESSTELYIKWAHLNTLYGSSTTDTQFYQKDHVSKNSKGGYSWQLAGSMTSNGDAVNAFIRSLETWRCGTGMNWDLGRDTTYEALATDEINLVRLDDLPSNVLGRCWSRSSGCSNGSTIVWYINELDIEFDSTYSWYYGTGTTPSNQFDFETVSVHELGHGQQLGHVIDPSKIMHYSVGSGIRNTELHPYDKEGGEYVISMGVQNNSCGPNKFIEVSPGQCQISVPTSAFKADAQTVCPSEDVVFTDESSGVVSLYSWDFGSGANPAFSNSVGPHTVSYSTSGTKTIVLIVSNSFGADTSTYEVTVLPSQPQMPAPFIGDDSVCRGLVTYNVVDNGDASGYTWNLSSGGSFVGSTNQSSVQIDWSTTGTHTVSVVASNACGTSPTQIDTVFVLPDPVADFDYIADGTSVQFTLKASNYDNLEWTFGDGGKTNQTDPERQYPDRGTYIVKLIVWNECGSDSLLEEITVDFNAGTAELALSGLAVYPNPISSNDILHFTSYVSGELMILTNEGRVVHQEQMSGNQLVLPNLATGVYVIRVDTGNGVYNLRIQVME